MHLFVLLKLVFSENKAIIDIRLRPRLVIPPHPSAALPAPRNFQITICACLAY